MYDDEPGGSPTSGASPRWDALAALEPALLDLERDLRSAAARRRQGTSIDQIWHHSGFKHRLTRLVGWHARNPALRDCDAYDAAYRHLWRVLETSTRYRRRVGA